jgi:hypothetical protein
MRCGCAPATSVCVLRAVAVFILHDFAVKSWCCGGQASHLPSTGWCRVDGVEAAKEVVALEETPSHATASDVRATRELFARHDPAMVAPGSGAFGKLLKMYHGAENEQLLALVVKKCTSDSYGHESMSDDLHAQHSARSGQGDNVNVASVLRILHSISITRAIRELYSRHNPVMLASGAVGRLLTKYHGAEDRLLAAVREKYTAEREHAALGYVRRLTDWYVQQAFTWCASATGWAVIFALSLVAIVGQLVPSPNQYASKSHAMLSRAAKVAAVSCLTTKLQSLPPHHRADGDSSAAVAVGMPYEFMCPISCEIMEDPVTTLAGNTYEKAQIVQWLHTNQTDPLTNMQLVSKRLVSNNALRSLIQAWKHT